MKKIVLGLFSLVFVCMLFGPTSVMAQNEDLNNSERLVKISAELSSHLRMLQKEEIISGRHPKIEEIATKRYEEVWNTLTVDEQKQVIEIRINKSHERILDIINFLSSWSTRFPYKGIGIRFNICIFNAVTSGAPLCIDNIFKSGPAVGLLKLGDLILAVDKIRLDDFSFRPEEQKLENQELNQKLHEKYGVKFLEAVANSNDVVKLEIKRDALGDKKITVEIKKATIGEDFSSQIESLRDELRNKASKLFEAPGNIREDLVTALANEDNLRSKFDILQSKFKEAFLTGFEDVQTTMEKLSEIVYEPAK